MHRNWTSQNQEKPSRLLHHVDWHIVTGLESLYHWHHCCENLDLTKVEAMSMIFLRPHYRIFLDLNTFILSHFPVINDMWISSVLDLKALSKESIYQSLHAAVFMFVLVLYILILSVPQYITEW
jgi:hypothetical protein